MFNFRLTTVEELTQLSQEMGMMDSLIRAGWLSALTMSNRAIALQNLIVHEVLAKRKEAMDQFRHGLMTLGVHSAVQVCPEEMKVYFLYQRSPLTASKVIKLFKDLHVVQEVEKAERARGFLVECMNTIERGTV